MYIGTGSKATSATLLSSTSADLRTQYLFTCCMEESPSKEDDRSTASQEIPHIFWNPEVHHHVQRSPPPAPYPVPNEASSCSLSHTLKIRINIILPSIPRSSKWSLSLRFLHHNPVCTYSVSSICYMPFPSHSSWFDHPNSIWWVVQIKSPYYVIFSTLLLPCPS